MHADFDLYLLLTNYYYLIAKAQSLNPKANRTVARQAPSRPLGNSLIVSSLRAPFLASCGFMTVICLGAIIMIWAQGRKLAERIE